MNGPLDVDLWNVKKGMWECLDDAKMRSVEEAARCQSDSDEVTVSESLVTQTVSMETESSTIATAPST